MYLVRHGMGAQELELECLVMGRRAWCVLIARIDETCWGWKPIWSVRSVSMNVMVNMMRCCAFCDKELAACEKHWINFKAPHKKKLLDKPFCFVSWPKSLQREIYYKGRVLQLDAKRWLWTWECEHVASILQLVLWTFQSHIYGNFWIMNACSGWTDGARLFTTECKNLAEKRKRNDGGIPNSKRK